MSYEENRVWSDQFLPEIMQILRREIPLGEMRIADEHLDQNQATDIVFVGQNTHFANRVRRYKYYPEYWPEITIRRYVPGGLKTEAHKIMEGFGDYMIYSFAAEDDSRIIAWTIINLEKLREAFRSPDSWLIEHGRRKNGRDGIIFTWVVKDSLPDGVIVKEWQEQSERQPSLERNCP